MTITTRHQHQRAEYRCSSWPRDVPVPFRLLATDNAGDPGAGGESRAPGPKLPERNRFARVDADAGAGVGTSFRVWAPVYVLLRNGKASLPWPARRRNNVAGWLAHAVDGKPSPPSRSQVRVRRERRSGTDDRCHFPANDRPARAGVGRLLGAVVRAVPHGRPVGRSWRGSMPAAVVGKAQRRREPGDASIPGHEHPRVDLQERPGSSTRLSGAQPYQALQQHLARFV